MRLISRNSLRAELSWLAILQMVSLATNSQTQWKPQVSANSGPVPQFRGFAADWVPKALDQGCMIHKEKLGSKAVAKHQQGQYTDCQKRCDETETCVGAVMVDAAQLCLHIEYLEFTDQWLSILDKIYLKDCRGHVCAGTCHCWDGDPYKEECQIAEEEVANNILQQAAEKLIIIDADHPHVTKDLLDEWLQAAGLFRQAVKVIILRNDKIESISKDAFEGMSSLRYLNLDDNVLADVDGVFSSIPQLEVLMLLNNRITSLTGDTFKGFGELKYLDVSTNLLKEVGDSAFQSLNKLETLRLLSAHDMLNISEKAFANLKSLKTLAISGGSAPYYRDYEHPAYDLTLLPQMPKLSGVKTPLSYNPSRFETPLDNFPICIHESKCYQDCEDIKPDYLNRGNQKFYFQLNLETLNTDIKEQLIVAQTTYLSHTKQLIIPDDVDWKIITRELLIRGDVYRNMVKHGSVDGCRIKPVRMTDGRLLFRFVYEGLNVLASKIFVSPASIINHDVCWMDPWEEGTEPPSVPVEYLDEVTKCAELLTYSDRRSVAVEMLDSIKQLYDIQPGHSTTILMKAMMIKANLPERWNPSNSGPEFVPLLSLSVYHDNYYGWAQNALLHLEEYETLVQEENRLTNWDTLHTMMNAMADKLAKFSGVTVENAKEELALAQEGVAKIRRKYASQLETTKSAQNVLLEVIDEMLTEEEFDWLESTFDVTLAFFGSIRSFDPVGALSLGAELWEGYDEHAETADTLASVATGCTNMLKALEGGSMDIDEVETYLHDIDKASDLKVRLVEWDHMAPQISLMLRTAGLENEAGLADFEFAVEQLASWGKRLTEEVIMQASLVKRLGEKVAMLQARREQTQLSSQVSREVSSSRNTVQSRLAPFKRNLFDERLKLLEMMSLYCQSYLHYYLRECADDMVPTAQENLKELIQKAYRSKGTGAESLFYSLRQPPQKFHEVITVRDRPNSNPCVSASECPITAFKKVHGFTFKIPLDSQVFQTYDRVRVEEIQVHMTGIKGEGSYAISFRSMPYFKDRLKDSEFQFYSLPRMFTFKYNAHADRVNTYGRVHDEYDDLFSEITPFTDWTISYNPRYNRGMDFSEVTEITLTFKGNAISRLIYDLKRK